MITKETAHRIACAHYEIEAAEKLIADIEATPEKGPRDPSDGMGYRGGSRYGIELGVRVNDSSMRCFDVVPALAAKVLKAHVEAKREEIKVLSVVAVEEADCASGKAKAK